MWSFNEDLNHFSDRPDLTFLTWFSWTQSSLLTQLHISVTSAILVLVVRVQMMQVLVVQVLMMQVLVVQILVVVVCECFVFTF